MFCLLAIWGDLWVLVEASRFGHFVIPCTAASSDNSIDARAEWKISKSEIYLEGWHHPAGVSDEESSLLATETSFVKWFIICPHLLTATLCSYGELFGDIFGVYQIW